DYFVMGDDWAGQFDELEQLTDAQVIYLPRTPEISTTQIKNELNSLNSDK
ncbi:TPA: glycerol-3-phosphate cytidylyltransferase, partial [Enterococcus faecium]|nr:glycerol-3-phosphate cytidylyltransferase [Enterococcus faecium]